MQIAPWRVPLKSDSKHRSQIPGVDVTIEDEMPERPSEEMMRDRMRLESRGLFRVLGVDQDAEAAEANDPDFSRILGRFASRHEEVTPYSLDGAFYGVFFHTDDGVRYLAGLSVPLGMVAAKGLVAVDIAAADYAVFDTTVGAIGSEDFTTWLPEYGLRPEAGAPRFDFHPPGTHELSDPISVWIPVSRQGEQHGDWDDAT